jgi:Na+-transporting NADH:ubiquinone oxidoreductase subunit NqrB
MKGWKTLIFNIGAAVLTVLIGYNWTDVLSAYPWAPPLIIALCNFGLRFVTDTPVMSSTPKPSS